MQFPISIPLGGWPVPLHPVFEAAAFFIGFRYFLHLRSKRSDIIPSPNRVWILIGATFGAFLGSRLVGALENPYELVRADNVWLYLFASKTVVGGFLGGLAGVELVKKIIGEKQASGDLFVYPILLALCIGRIGCFSMGVFEETYGLPTTLPWGMNLGDGLRRHPVSLYEIAFLVLLWIVLYKLQQRLTLANGALFKLFMIAYLLFRFALDFIKPHFTWGIGLSGIQLASLAGLLYYAPFIAKPKKLLAAYA